MPTSYKLTYFDVRALGETARLLFHYAGVQFEDNRITHEQWAALKPTMPFGQVPVLQVDGHTIPQSFAIYRFLANEFGLAGKTNVEKADLDAIADSFKDFYDEAKNYIYVVCGFREGDADAMYKAHFVPAVEKFFPIYEKVLAESRNGFFVKGGISWVDFYVANSLLTLTNLKADVLDKYPHLKKLKETVHSLPQLKEYVTKRPETKA
ncbi:hypothetical protein L596_002366 [Steinernema carpocapsae]|uniref:glutathione transferase n=1 Tax=Steinernema carpocapsae TaxID=34508 RepID=A0A4U8UQ29_STECR|nr:hypothetical protein L596_002366 [Steinernema carpocapsae]